MTDESAEIRAAEAALNIIKAELVQLRERLEAAEMVCTLFGWTGGGDWDSDRFKATLQAWMDWSSTYDQGRAPRTPEWDQRIAELAARRDTKRAETMRKLFTLLAEEEQR